MIPLAPPAASVQYHIAYGINVSLHQLTSDVLLFDAKKRHLTSLQQTTAGWDEHNRN